MAVQSVAAPYPHIPSQRRLGQPPLIVMLLQPISRLLADFARAQWAAARYERLSQLSDGALRARGLSRGELSRHVYGQAFGSVD